MKVSGRSKKLDILKAYEHLKKEADRHQKVMHGLSEEFSSLRGDHKKLQERTDFIDGLRRQLTSLNERMDLLTKISQELNSLDLDRILDVCVSKIPFLVNAKYTSVYLYDPEREVLVLRKNNHDRTIQKEISRSDTRSLMGLALDREGILVIDDLGEFGRKSDVDILRPYADAYTTNSCIVAPLIVGDQIVGVINFADRNDGVPFSANLDLQPIRTLVGVLGASIRNIQLYEQVRRQSTLDGLTGLMNHTAFIQTLEREVNRARRYKPSLSLVLTDVDQFRSHNANLGHEGGDAILGLVARVLARTLRSVDLAARYGPDEFAVILPETPLEGATNLAARLLEEIEKEEFSFRGRSYSISASAGVVSLTSEMTQAELLSLAEGAIRGLRDKGERGLVATVSSPPEKG
ncbi:MAG: sensor domain-containing diguanylate cyclase [Planctomycetota bacterium]|nr:sensor domain-containing diguanylate cyclase [Planctomycetota bacterium]